MALQQRQRVQKGKGVEVHVCRFINYKPSTICAADLHRDDKHCAIGRENGNIEIWDLNGSFIQRIIPGKGPNTVQSLLWINTRNQRKLRLISCGLDGWLNEYNLESLSITSKISSHGYAIWDIAQSAIIQTNNENIINSNDAYNVMISAACDDGKIRVYRLTENEFIFQCEFNTSGRCLSTTWSKKVYQDKNEPIVVYGGTSNGLIFGFDIITRQQMVNIVVAPPAVKGVRKNAPIKPLIWSLCSLPEFDQIACSTSRGSIDIFDTKFETLIQSVNAAKNDIFSLEYIKNEHDNLCMLIAGCVDGRVLQLTQRNHSHGATAGTKFVQTGYHRYHTHDVNVVAVTNNTVVSGGVDTQLISCRTRDFWTHYICSPLSNTSNVIHIANNVAWIHDILPKNEQENKLKNKLFLHQMERQLELWYLYGGENENECVTDMHPIKVMDINVGFSVYNILCCDISNDGQWIAVSNNVCIKLWKVKINDKRVELVKMLETSQRGSTTITFSKDSKYLFLTPTISEINYSKDEDTKMEDVNGTIGQDLDENKDKNANIIRIDLSQNSDENGEKIDRKIHIKSIGHYLISALRLNEDSSLCGVIVPSLMYAVIVHIDLCKIFYEIPRGVGNNNISCIEFQKNRKSLKGDEELIYVVYANNAIKIFYYDSFKDTNKLFKSKNNLRLHLWCSSNSKLWNIYNKNNPFSFTKILFNPSTCNKALMMRSEYIFSLMVNKKLPDTHFAGVGTKRTFAMTGNSDDRGGSVKRMRIDQMIPSPFGKPGGGKSGKQKKKKMSFLRVIRKYDPIVYGEFIGENTLLIVHAPWHKVSASFKQPLYRKKYAI